MSLTTALLRRFAAKHSLFIETGVGVGAGVQRALDAGFRRIVSIEAYPEVLELARQKFAGDSRVEFVLGDSTVELERVLAGVAEPALFWLDAHFRWWPGSAGLANPCPLLIELEAISRHPIKTHTILVDDIFTVFESSIPQWKETETECGAIGLPRILEAVLRVNPAYAVSYEDGVSFGGDRAVPGDILVAEIKEGVPS
jgi:hypothetical protein